MLLKIIMRARDIPMLDAAVTKMHGHKKYTLTDTLFIFHENKQVQEIEADAGTRFLLSDKQPKIEAVSADTELVWHVELDTFLQWLQEQSES